MKKYTLALTALILTAAFALVFAGCAEGALPEAQKETPDFTVKELGDLSITTGGENTIEIGFSLSLSDGVEKIDNADFKLVLAGTTVPFDVYYAYNEDEAFIKAESAVPVAQKEMLIKIKNSANFKTKDGVFSRVLYYKSICIASGINVTVQV